MDILKTLANRWTRSLSRVWLIKQQSNESSIGKQSGICAFGFFAELVRLTSNENESSDDDHRGDDANTNVD